MFGKFEKRMVRYTDDSAWFSIAHLYRNHTSDASGFQPEW